MSTEHERELRIIVNDAQVRKSDYRSFEALMVIHAILTLVVVAILSAEMYDLRHLLVLASGGALLCAAYFRSYAEAILQPALECAQQNLNDFIDYN